MDREAERCKKQLEQFRKDPQNKRCANCASLAVPYICLDFGTFVCTRCSALHRDMTHRVKSITASKFSPAEVATIRGNAYDAQMYLANWHEGLFRLPAAGNEETERAKEFMAIKYNEKRWAHESIRPQQQVYQQPQPQQPTYQPQQPHYQPAQPQPFVNAPTGAPTGAPMGIPMGAPMAMPGPAPSRPFGAAQPFAQPQPYNNMGQPAPQPVAQPAPQPIVEDPFADLLGPSQPIQQAPQSQPVQPAPQSFTQPQFNPAQPSGYNPATFNPQPHPQAQPQPKQFNVAAFTAPQPAPKAAGSWDMFGDMVKKASGGAAPNPNPQRPQQTKPVAAPAPKVDNLLDF